MEKGRKPTSTKKPPEPSESHAEIDEWMQRRIMPDLKPMIARIDEMIREEVPDLRYAVKWKQAYYGTPDHGWVIELAAYDVSANIVFFGGADFETPPPLGNTDRSRYIKVRSVDDVEQPEIRKWIKNAGRVDGWEWS